jgi:ABC-type sugar transport system ATPase subunit
VTAAAIARVEGVSKRYGGVVALEDVSLELLPGEAHALVGENGAGKSTLVRLLAGATAPTSGSIVVGERRFAALTPARSQALGIRVVHQELALADGLSVAENVFLGSEPRRPPRFLLRPDRRAMRRRAAGLLEQLGVDVSPDARVATLSVGHKQVIEIAKGLAADAKLFVLDEPTAPLTPAEVDRLHRVVRELKARGVAVLYISHRLQEVFDLCETATVLRDGRRVETAPVASLDRRALVKLMVGRDLGNADESAPPHHPSRTIGAVRLEARGLSTATGVADASFTVRAGEVVGFAGLVGAGRTETLRALVGADPRSGGELRLDGRPLAPRSPREAIAAGLGLLPEDRAAQGTVAARPIAENVALAVLPRLSRCGVLARGRLRALAAALAATVRLKAASLDAPVASLSGGNQQKVVLARWLAARCQVLLLDEPTRGIDVGARQEIYQALRDLSRDGAALLVASSSLPELLALTDRLYVFREGRIVGELETARATSEEVMQLAAR